MYQFWGFFFFYQKVAHSILEKVLPKLATGAVVRTHKHNIQTAVSNTTLNVGDRAIDYSRLTLFPSHNIEWKQAMWPWKFSQHTIFVSCPTLLVASPFHEAPCFYRRWLNFVAAIHCLQTMSQRLFGFWSQPILSLANKNTQDNLLWLYH